MPEVEIRGIPVNFPFEPYKVQRDYMEKVIECLQTGTHGVLESPTGTGKTLSLLCSTLAWLLTKKAQVQAARGLVKKDDGSILPSNNLNNLNLDAIFGHDEAEGGGSWGVPKIIYASRTHSQLTQAMGEMKRTSYGYLKAAIIGSRDQLCIHPDVMNETGNTNKVYLCRAKVKSKTCSFHSKVERAKEHPEVRERGIMDIEDLVVTGRKLKCCPYYLSKELVERADIVFMPYNYLLDPKARKANNLELHNAVIILDEAHNVEKMCEEAASVQIKSSDVAMCIEEVTGIMKTMVENQKMGFTDDEERDFTVDDLATLKELLLAFERTLDQEQINFTEGTTFAGSYIFDLLSKAGINDATSTILLKLLDELVQFVTTMAEKSGMSAQGGSLSLFADMLTIVFASKDVGFRERVRRCYKVHITVEEQKAKGQRQSNGWTSMKQPSVVRSNAKQLSFWCFNPGFGMAQVLSKNVHSIILTSGTLAPLKPLISELGIPIHVRLENPHIINDSQVYVKIIATGPDKETLLSNYDNRNNPKYIQSLGRTILSVSPSIPGGLLIFFPSYTILNKCQQDWLSSGIWGQISRIKAIFIEPRTKDEFNIVMSEYYARINDPQAKGAIFMAVCRGKVSEGLDFADMNGRGVIITGLPFPPVKDARVVLKRRYLEENRTHDNQILSGSEWYGLEAVRAVNQAIGRVIRHKNDYGCILLCDTRFNDRRQRDQLSRWIQNHLKAPESNFGKIIGELSRFFKEAERNLPPPGLKPPEFVVKSPAKELADKMNYESLTSKVNIKTEATMSAIKIENSNSVPSWTTEDYGARSVKIEAWGEFIPQNKSFSDMIGGSSSRSIDFNDCTGYEAKPSLVTIHKRTNEQPSQDTQEAKRKRLAMVGPKLEEFDVKNVKLEVVEVLDTSMSFKEKVESVPLNRIEFLRTLKSVISLENYRKCLYALGEYRADTSVEKVITGLFAAFQEPETLYLLVAMRRFINDGHKVRFDARVKTFLKPYGIEMD